jgi:hypothetical protein
MRGAMLGVTTARSARWKDTSFTIGAISAIVTFVGHAHASKGGSYSLLSMLNFTPMGCNSCIVRTQDGFAIP